MFFKPILTQHFKEVSRKNIFHRNYICTEEMIFSTGIFGKEFKIYRESDGLILAELKKSGVLIIYPGYYWDGPSGPTIDTVAFVWGSAPHDVIYQALRENLLIQPELYQHCMPCFEDDFEYFRKIADNLMKKINEERGMKNPRLWYTWKAVRSAGAKYSMPQELNDWIKAS